jgi:hypothetical protein
VAVAVADLALLDKAVQAVAEMVELITLVLETLELQIQAAEQGVVEPTLLLQLQEIPAVQVLLLFDTQAHKKALGAQLHHQVDIPIIHLQLLEHTQHNDSYSNRKWY